MEEGGETNFPDGTPTRNFKARHASQSLSPCGAQGERAAVVPKKGSALVFWDMDPSSESEDYLSYHTGCPVVSGTKWSVTMW